MNSLSTLMVWVKLLTIDEVLEMLEMLGYVKSE